MTLQPPSDRPALQIKTPCPKSWDELTGDDKLRFCSACSLHVHNAAQLSRVEAQALVTNATARVCMRMEFDASGAPLFRDSQAASLVFTPASESRFKRLSRWAVTAAAGVLAACHGSLSSSVTSDPSTPSAGQPPSKMGKVCSTTLIGDVAEPVPSLPVRLGEVMMDPEIAPVAPPDEH